MSHSRQMLAAAWIAVLAILSASAGAQPAPGGPRAGAPKYPPYDGSRHNKDRPNWGRGGSPYIRVQVPQTAYGPGPNAMAGSKRLSPREITLALLNQPYFKAKSATNTSYLLTGLGQLVSHDITRGLANNKSNGGPAPIPIPPGDPIFSTFKNEELQLGASRRALPYTRTNFTRLTPNGPREQINDATAWLDASCLYGSSAKTVRTIRAGTAGRLQDDGNRLLPLNVEPDSGLPKDPNMKNIGERVPLTQLRLSGNSNVNQNPMIMTMVTLFMREHNRRAAQIERDNPSWGDEEIFQEARKWVIGHFQRIALVDYLAALGITLPPWKAYNASLNPGIDAFFSTVAYRYGHSTINDVLLRLDEAWGEHPRGHLPLAFAYYNPNVALDAGLEPLIRGLLVAAQGKVEPRWSLAVSGNFAGHSSVNGSDLAAINIQRGRDHGIPDYNTCRRALGLPAAATFSDITPDPNIAAIMQRLYGDVNNIDAYVGGLAEPHEGNSHMGPLFTRSLQEQFTRLRDADYFYYENGAANGLYNASEIDEIRKTSLRDIIARNTDIKDLPADLWNTPASMMCVAPGGGSGAGGSGSGGSGELQLTNLLGGSARLQVRPADKDGWARVTVSSQNTDGWLGFGVADKDSSAAMIGADMVVGRMVDGKPVVKRYHAVDHIPPLEVPQAGQDRIRGVRFEQSPGGGVAMEFERPLDGGAEQYDRPMPTREPLRLIIARGRSNAFGSMNDYHGTANREIIELPRGLYAGGSSLTIDNAARTKRKAHGVLMAVNFVVVMPLGALAARQLRCHWLRAPRLRASLFYVHIATQVAGVAIATAGFVIATRWFGVPYGEVQYGHGKLGVAILTLVYSQLLMGFLRPAASAPTVRRQAWDLVHSTLGRAAMIIGIANVALGVTIFSQLFGGHFPLWAGLCAAALGAITLAQYVLDRQEKYAVLKNDAELSSKLFGRHSRDLGDDTEPPGGSDDYADGAGDIGDAAAGKSFPGGASSDAANGANRHHAGHQTHHGGMGVPAGAAAAGAAGAGAAGMFGAHGGGGGYAAAAADGAPYGAYDAAGGAGAAGSPGGGGPKLTASLLRQHHASAGGGGGAAAAAAGLGHPGFDGAGGGAGPGPLHDGGGGDMGAQPDQWGTGGGGMMGGPMGAAAPPPPPPAGFHAGGGGLQGAGGSGYAMPPQLSQQQLSQGAPGMRRAAPGGPGLPGQQGSLPTF